MSIEVILPRRVVPQPTPNLNAGGDCGACVLAGLLGLTPEHVYERFQKRVKPFGWHEMRGALWQAENEDLLDRIVTNVPMWPWEHNDGFVAFGPTAGGMCLAWWNYLRMAMDAGYYGIAEVDMKKAGPYGHGTDHWVMIVGVRQRRIPFEKGATIKNEILLSCSARTTPDEEWVADGDFLTARGGFNVLLARPSVASLASRAVED